MSLPEQLGGQRNFDYRYVWIRDAAFCMYALLRLGFGAEAKAFMGFLRTQVEPWPGHQLGPLQIMYGIDGRADLPERELTYLAGYACSAPVREGNAAANQLQLDIYGELIDAVTCTTSGVSRFRATTGRPCTQSWTGSVITGTNLTRASGKPGVGVRTLCIRG